MADSAERRQVRSVREYLNHPDETQFWDDELLKQYIVNDSPDQSNDQNMVEDRDYNRAMLARAQEEGIQPDELNTLAKARLNQMNAQGWPEDARYSNIEDLQSQINTYPGYNQTNAKQIKDIVSGGGNVSQDFIKNHLGGAVSQSEMEALKRQVQQFSNADAPTTSRAVAPIDNTMRYSGYDVLGNTKRGNKVIRLK